MTAMQSVEDKMLSEATRAVFAAHGVWCEETHRPASMEQEEAILIATCVCRAILDWQEKHK